MWWSFVSVGKVVAAHNLWKSIRMCCHVRNSLFVVTRGLVRDHIT